VTRLGGPSARAAGLAAAGVVALVASRGFGTPALAVLGVGLIALPLLVTALVWAGAAGIRPERRIAPARARAGDPVRVGVVLGARAGLERLLDITVDPGLGSAAGGGAGAERGGVWSIPSAPRGDHRLPPARVTVMDPFGLARRTRVATGADRLLVVPRAPLLDGAPVGVRAVGHGPRRRRAREGFGELDRVRDYRAGDPLSRVHWAQTAKRGRLQTKELLAPEGGGRTVLLLLDGTAPAGEAFETAVTATAALARHLLIRGEGVALAHTGAPPARVPAARAAWPALELALAQVAPGGDGSTASALRAEATAPDAPDLIVVVTSAAEPAVAGELARARALGIGVAAVLAGPAAAAAGDIAALGAEAIVVPGPDRVAAALSREPARARVP
jgi:uncharacterized protein (DUF58 family)